MRFWYWMTDVFSGYGTHEQLLASNEIYHDIYISQTKGDNGHDEA